MSEIDDYIQAIIKRRDSHDWEEVEVEILPDGKYSTLNHSLSKKPSYRGNKKIVIIQRCKKCGFIKDRADSSIPFCDEYKMEQALE